MLDSARKEFDDWIDLLKRTKNENLLEDPYNIWLEAWTLATMKAKKDPTNSAGSNTP
jgi:hypothetical protein